MPLFTRRDRIAIAVIAALIIAGWSVAYLRAARRETGFRLIRDAVPVPAETAAPTGVPTADTPLDLNAADAADLELLPGIGPVRAAAIVAYRNEHGPFGRIDDLAAVHGIGAATVDRVRSIVTVESPPAHNPAP